MREPINISLIIPTLNAGAGFENLLRALAAQQLPLQEIIVVDSGSRDSTLKTAVNCGAEVIEIAPDMFDHGGTRNLGAARAKGDILVFMTQDAFPVNEKLTACLAEAFQDPQVAVCYARQVAAPAAAPSEKYLRLANYPAKSQVRTAESIPSQGIKAFQNSNACAAYRRQVFEKLGRFPEPVVCNEDMLFAARAILAGFKVAYCAEALVEHTHSYPPALLFRRYFDIGASLHRQPEIEALGQANSKGLEFVKGYMAYLKQEKKLYYLPLAALETAARYCGFALGRRHQKIPRRLKKHLGLNRNYWSRLS